jgi:DNA-binding SARP family transcriptional activator
LHSIRMLGPIRVDHGTRTLGPRDFGGIKPKQIFEILLAARGRAVFKDQLADWLWGEDLPQNVSGALETHVSVLRRNLEPGCKRESSLIVTQSGGYRLAVERAEVDIDAFDDLLARAAAASPATARALREQALELVRGELLEDEPYSEWARALRDRYRGLLVETLVDVAEAALADDDAVTALHHAQRAVGADPLSERGYRLSMLASYALGRQEDSLRTFDQCRTVLGAELGVDPLEETLALHAAILRHDEPALLLPDAQRDATRENRDRQGAATPFLGRAAELDALREAAARALEGTFEMVFVEGVEGVGKSRLLDEAIARLSFPRVGFTRCSALESRLPYAALSAALAPVVMDAADDDALAALDVIAGDATPNERWPVEPVMYASRMRALELLAHSLRVSAPLVLVIDDAQWADPSSISALAYLQRRCADHPILVIVATRPDALGRHEPLRLRVTDRVTLGPLRDGDLAAAGDAGIVAATGGHPAFVASYLAGRRAGDDAPIPACLEDTVLDRCRRLEPAQHGALLGACLLDDPFEPEVLAVMLRVDAEPLAATLDELCDAGLLRVERAGYAFEHAVVRRLLCEELDPPRRRLLKQRAAAAEALVLSSLQDAV